MPRGQSLECKSGTQYPQKRRRQKDSADPCPKLGRGQAVGPHHVYGRPREYRGTADSEQAEGRVEAEGGAEVPAEEGSRRRRGAEGCRSRDGAGEYDPQSDRDPKDGCQEQTDAPGGEDAERARQRRAVFRQKAERQTADC